ncbi:hypothetical protein UY3_06268 [Chelonia mydas]|uniref:Uncharacterized protein n=1 Tax=Chelonia mydas TaxID=8469 RepID=M7BWW6_CHEMY|nr:hypothetical protein UY3_06268 [Chelonia mydas]
MSSSAAAVSLPTGFSVLTTFPDLLFIPEFDTDGGMNSEFFNLSKRDHHNWDSGEKSGDFTAEVPTALMAIGQPNLLGKFQNLSLYLCPVS